MIMHNYDPISTYGKHSIYSFIVNEKEMLIQHNY